MSLDHPAQLAGFSFTFLVSPLGSVPFGVARLLGLVFICSAITGLLLHTRNYSKRRKSSAFFIYLCLFLILTAFLAALGRLNYGVDEMKAGRYRTPALIFWASMLGLGFSWWNAMTKRFGRSLGPPIVAFLFVAIVVASCQVGSIYHVANLRRRLGDDGIALAFDPSDRVYRDLFGPKPDLVRQYALFLRQNQLSIFSDQLFTSAGKSLSTRFTRISIQACVGAFENFKAEDTGRTRGSASGWCLLQNQIHGPDMIIFADDRGTIVGLATGMERRRDIAAVYLHDPEILDTGWSGYLRMGFTSRFVAAYALLRDRTTLCPIGQIVLPQAESDR